jgi:DNA-binding NtrC family response regulator
MTHISALPVLLVDDDPQILQSASVVLRTSGVTPVIRGAFCRSTASKMRLATCDPSWRPSCQRPRPRYWPRPFTEALRRAGGNQGVAAGLLGISRQALNKRLRYRQPTECSVAPAE